MPPFPRLHEFQVHHGPYPLGPPSRSKPITNPLSLLLCRLPTANNVSNPNFALIHSRPITYSEYETPLYMILTASSDAPISRPRKSGAQTFWMKTYSENAGMLEALEKEGILKRNGEVRKQGYVTLVGVETGLVEGEWANTCSGASSEACERAHGMEQMDDGEQGRTRMKRCAGCGDVWYCGRECQREGWGGHKGRCGMLKEARKGNMAVEEGEVEA